MSKKQRIPQPIDHGVADVPVITQYENQECGAVSLSMVLGYYGKWLPAGEVKEDVGPCRDGANAYHIAKAAESYGLKSEVARYKAPEFFEKVEMETRVFGKQHYLFPIPDAEMRRNPKMVQNYGWTSGATER